MSFLRYELFRNLSKTEMNPYFEVIFLFFIVQFEHTHPSVSISFSYNIMWRREIVNYYFFSFFTFFMGSFIWKSVVYLLVIICNEIYCNIMLHFPLINKSIRCSKGVIEKSKSPLTYSTLFMKGTKLRQFKRAYLQDCYIYRKIRSNAIMQEIYWQKSLL